MTANRIPAQASLTKILPEGTEGGKEFARITSLLLLKQAKATGRTFAIFDDASGDFEGLDSYSFENKTKNAIGYQYKFYPSPLSNSHRQKITEALDNAIKKSSQLKLKKWILVTPDDLKNSGTRKNGGDVSWFEELRTEKEKHGLEIEHIGHTKLQDLFLGAPLVSLFYYPQLVPNGASRAKTIEEIRAAYDLQMTSRYGRIEFVGMPVYKEDTSRRVPLDEIYIPLSVVGERAAPETDETPRINPITLLERGKRSVVLGDPGSGKSTMLAYLALVGISSSLQARSGACSDDRLTVVIALRRYADELKHSFDLPLVEHMVNVAAADFNLLGVSPEFFEFYLETGRAIVMFDGLDELPSSKFKATVKQRIESFSSAYPLSSIVITSRLVGYDIDFRLDNSYAHYRVAKLRLPEIKKFIFDWYSARLDHQRDIKNNSNDLIGVVERAENESIRDLARNRRCCINRCTS
ncbi:NACHT domain-containing protein, partial [Comamonas thiooxydans]